MASAEIVISGVTGHYGKADNLNVLKENLFNGVEAQTTTRWDIGLPLPAKMAYISDADKFDAEFFSVKPGIANSRGPESRKVLEAAYEAIVDAGLVPSDLSGTNCGVYVASSIETLVDFYGDKRICPRGTAYDFSCLDCLIPGCISYWLNLKGPSLKVETGCSSSLTAFHLACEDIRSGRCDSALVVAVSLHWTPNTSPKLLNEGVLSADGLCKTFDITADGFGIGEGSVAIFLQKADSAKRIYCSVMGSRIGCEGYKSGIKRMSGPAHAEMVQQLYTQIGLSPMEVCYVEMHGPGTQVGDFEETDGLDRTFSPGRQGPLLVGSIKSNVGHTETAAGITGIIKCVLAMETGYVPGNMHCKTLNPKLPSVVEGRIKLVTEKTALPSDYVAVQAFGVGGSMAHVILKRHKKQKGVPSAWDLPVLVGCSGRNEEAIHAITEVLDGEADAEFVRLLHDIFRKEIAPNKFRGYVLVGQNGCKKQEIKECAGSERLIYYQFQGMSSHWKGMHEDFLKIPEFERTVSQCNEILKHKEIDLFSVMAAKNLQDYCSSFMGFTVFQICMVNLLKSLGVSSSSVIDCSEGQMMGAYADGRLSLEDTVLQAYNHARNQPRDKETKTEENSDLPDNAVVLNFGPAEYPEVSSHNGWPNAAFLYQNTENGVEDLFQALGRLFISGVSMDLSKLYPEIPFPVSRGTRMISPLVRWDHSKSYLMPKGAHNSFGGLPEDLE